MLKIIIVVLATLCMSVLVAKNSLSSAFENMSKEELETVASRYKGISGVLCFTFKAIKSYTFYQETEEIRVLKDAIIEELGRCKNKRDVDWMGYIFASTLIEELSEEIIGREIETEAGPTEGIYGYYSYKEDLIFINTYHVYDAILQKGSAYKYYNLLNTVCHELRHVWQHDNKWKTDVKYVSSKEDRKAYRRHPREKDARKYALLKVFFMSSKRKEQLLRKCYLAIAKWNNVFNR